MEILVRGAAQGSDPPPTRLLKVVRRQGTKDIDLLLPETADIVSTGWVPEIVYEATEQGYALRAVIRPDMEALRPSVKAPPVDATANGDSHAAPVTGSPLPACAGAPHSPAQASKEDVLYEATFRNREIRVNGFRLSRPNFNSENEVVFEYLFRNANRRVALPELEAAAGRPLAKRLREVVRDLGFTGELRELFFPGVSKTAVEFVNPVTRADFDARGLRAPRIEAR